LSREPTSCDCTLMKKERKATEGRGRGGVLCFVMNWNAGERRKERREKKGSASRGIKGLGGAGTSPLTRSQVGERIKGGSPGWIISYGGKLLQEGGGWDKTNAKKLRRWVKGVPPGMTKLFETRRF